MIPQCAIEKIVQIDEETKTSTSDIHDLDTTAIRPSVYSTEVLTIVHVDLTGMRHK